MVITRFFRYTELNDIADQTLEEVVNELDNFATISQYENSSINDKASIKATNLYLGNPQIMFTLVQILPILHLVVEFNKNVMVLFVNFVHVKL